MNEKPRALALGRFADSIKPENLCRAAFTRLQAIQMSATSRAGINELRWQMQRADRMKLDTDQERQAFNDATETIWLLLEEALGEYLPPFCDLKEDNGVMEVVPDWLHIDEMMRVSPNSDRGPFIADACHVLGKRGSMWALVKTADFRDRGQFTLRQRIGRGKGFTWKEVWTADRPKSVVLTE